MANKTKMTVEQFIALLWAAHEAGMTRDEFAKKSGIESSTVYQRVYELNKEGAGLPVLPARKKMTVVERAKAALAEAKAKSKSAPKAEAKVPVKAEVKEVPAAEPEEQEDELEQLLNG